jgi:cell division protein ZapD
MIDPISAAVAAPPGWMTFEFPCNERMRSFMRIENLFRRCKEFVNQTTPAAHQAALWSLFELFDLVGGRGDIKNELLQELERQRARLNQFAGKPGVSHEVLDDLLNKIQRTFTDLSAAHTRIGPHISEHEWLQLLKGRFGIPGGICEFDVPSLHLWLHRPVEIRQSMLNAWLAGISAVYDGVQLVLTLLREGSQPESHLATRGYFELSMDGRTIQLIRVAVPKSPEMAAEISANKYVVSVRFRQPTGTMQLKSIEQDIPFHLTLCNF